ncbi:MAG: beta-ketoacyl-ACP synthase II [Mailhella sp.]|nr:beta-ketoacyl-ACP synthase II [Mailhella sp.]
MERKRVVITGVSAITPIGMTAHESWDALLAGRSGISKITQFDTTGFDTDIAGEIKNFDPETYIPRKLSRHMDRFVQLSACASVQLMEDSGYRVTDENAERFGVILGVGLGGLNTIERFHSRILEAGPSRVSPFSIPMLIPNMAPGQVAILAGAKGENLVLTSACASSAHAISMAYTEIVMGRADAFITGGSESTITAMGISGFTSMKALCTKYNDEPEKASRPFDADRGGFVMGEGAGLLFVESLESALKRGAHIYAEIAGCGASCDAYHIVAPREDAEGMAAAMRSALNDAGVRPEAVDYINAHGTSTVANDAAETKALHLVFKDHARKLAISSNKSQVGHLLGAAGGAEAVFTALALESGIVPGTLNLTNPDPACDLNYMPDGPKKLDPEYALSNSFGFGGTNASILFKKYRP